MGWKIEILNETVETELKSLPDDMQVRFLWISSLIKEHGLEHVGLPYVRHIEEKLWEIRITGRDGIARALYITATPKRVVILRVFVKKTQKAPRREIELALSRAKEVKHERS